MCVHIRICIYIYIYILGFINNNNAGCTLLASAFFLFRISFLLIRLHGFSQIMHFTTNKLFSTFIHLIGSFSRGLQKRTPRFCVPRFSFIMKQKIYINIYIYIYTYCIYIYVCTRIYLYHTHIAC